MAKGKKKVKNAAENGSTDIKAESTSQSTDAQTNIPANTPPVTAANASVDASVEKTERIVDDSIETRGGDVLSMDDVVQKEAPPALTAASGTPVQMMSMEELQAEVTALRAQLLVRDKELAKLKEQVKSDLVPASESTLTGIPQKADMQQLHERLAKLRKEQADADAARDAAWGQLKSVVAEISKLANPEYVAGLVQQQAPKP